MMFLGGGLAVNWQEITTASPSLILRYICVVRIPRVMPSQGFNPSQPRKNGSPLKIQVPDYKV